LALTKGVDIVVATPGRLMDLMNQKKLSLKEVEFFVLDEADRMLDMGFIHDIKRILAKLPSKKQSLFFSATMSPQINTLAKTLLKNPIHVEITPQATTVERIKQCVFFVDAKSKEKLLLELLEQKHLTSILVFTRTKHKANKVALFLNNNNISADAIHGNKSQNARTRAISDFKSGKIKVLVATDIAARGIDISNISHVINFELPNEPESYVHRIGRTARAGTDGTAYSFCEAQERSFLNSIIGLINQQLEVMEHKYHSEAAKNAKGIDAKPPPRKGRHGGSRGGFRGRSGSTGGRSGGRGGSSGGSRSGGRSGGRAGGSSSGGRSGGRAGGRSGGRGGSRSGSSSGSSSRGSKRSSR
jgi:ATP-dependent RNA helicase RhlE